jgi:hypothetical protein
MLYGIKLVIFSRFEELDRMLESVGPFVSGVLWAAFARADNVTYARADYVRSCIWTLVHGGVSDWEIRVDRDPA